MKTTRSEDHRPGQVLQTRLGRQRGEMRRMLAVPCANGVDPACWWARGTTWAVVRSHATLHARLR